MAKELYEHHLYTNSLYNFITQTIITEYDMKNAGYNIIKQFELLPKETIEWLGGMEKMDRTKQIGKLQRSTPNLTQKLNDGFIECRRWFFTKNEIKPEDVLAIKKDAIFTLRKCNETSVGHITFDEKHEYTDFIMLDKKEIYLGDDYTHVKGINDSLVKLHEEFMLDIIKTHVRNLSLSSKKHQINFLKEIMYYYKTLQLSDGYYREFNIDSMYKLKQGIAGESYGVDAIADIESVDIRFNLINVIIPLIETV